MVTPDQVRQKTFTISRRGFDQVEVSSFLVDVASSLEDALAAVDGGQPASGPVATAHPDLYQDEFTKVSGQMAELLRSAHEKSVTLKAEAEAEARATVAAVEAEIAAKRQAHEEQMAAELAQVELRAQDIKNEADNYSGSTRQQADTYSNEVRAEAEAYAESLRTEARQDAQNIIMEAEEYSKNARAQADTYHENRRNEADEYITAAKMDGDRDRQEAERLLDTAKADSEATVAQAERRAQDIIEGAKQLATARVEETITKGRGIVRNLIDAERDARERLGRAHTSLSTALDQLEVPDIPELAIDDDDDDRPKLAAVNDDLA